MAKTKSHPIGKIFESVHTFTSGICPHCGVVATFTHAGATGSIAGAAIGPRERWNGDANVLIAQCTCCKCIVVGMQERESRSHISRAYSLWPNETWPDNAPPNLETEIRQLYDEARAILFASPAGAALLARRCLQQVLRFKLGIKKGKLFDEINEAAPRSEFSQPTKEAMGHIREIGNWGAHPTVDQSDTLIDVEPEDAEYTLEALEMVFDDLYVASNRAKSMKDRIAARKAGLSQPVGS